MSEQNEAIAPNKEPVEGTGSQSPPDMIKTAYEVAERLKAENERMERNLRQAQEIKSFELLGGKSQGAPQQQIQKQETDKEYRLRIEKEIAEGKYNGLKLF